MNTFEQPDALNLSRFSRPGAPTWQRHKEHNMEKKQDIEFERSASIGAALKDELTVLSIITIACIVALWVAATL